MRKATPLATDGATKRRSASTLGCRPVTPKLRRSSELGAKKVNGIGVAGLAPHRETYCEPAALAGDRVWRVAIRWAASAAARR
ncbi:hypothetical protein GCM10022226_61560 [Sphaerisporangium flaviroseum]|uniref:Uncharacterized protein n=1 Tax=Sphaerisporangium flaviroseum TaxID=509199 RepID=A0ABP7J1F3_9ACTN